MAACATSSLSYLLVNVACVLLFEHLCLSVRLAAALCASLQVRLQFGKIQDDVFALDFTYPFTVEHAFALALATIDTKLCYTI